MLRMQEAKAKSLRKSAKAKVPPAGEELGKQRMRKA